MRVLAPIVALAAFLADQLSKFAMLSALNLDAVRQVDVLPPFLVFRMAWNRGINFGLFARDSEFLRWGLAGLATAVGVAVLIWAAQPGRSAPERIFAGLLAGGAFGNAVDRVVHGAVFDFLNMSCCGIVNPFSFNIADAAVFCGLAGFVIWGWKADRKA